MPTYLQIKYRQCFTFHLEPRVKMHFMKKHSNNSWSKFYDKEVINLFWKFNRRVGNRWVKWRSNNVESSIILCQLDHLYDEWDDRMRVWQQIHTQSVARSKSLLQTSSYDWFIHKWTKLRKTLKKDVKMKVFNSK